jgi:hypothetical protein
VVRALEALDLRYPEVDDETRARFGEIREILEGEPPTTPRRGT